MWQRLGTLVLPAAHLASMSNSSRAPRVSGTLEDSAKPSHLDSTREPSHVEALELRLVLGVHEGVSVLQLDTLLTLLALLGDSYLRSCLMLSSLNLDFPDQRRIRGVKASVSPSFNSTRNCFNSQPSTPE
mmetsp:Transcript_58025/g.125433  ORF Transcript_58025/g.125433 Transcript_58025/m.125433 type:complete len:130 (+) Transcript_58025:533-922(+)